MGVSIKCKVSLSKKLRSILKDSRRFSIIVSELDGGKGEGLLSLSSDEGASISEEDILQIGETSIMVTPHGFSNDLDEMGAEEASSLVDDALKVIVYNIDEK